MSDNNLQAIKTSKGEGESAPVFPKNLSQLSKIRKFFALLGPGLVTGAADDDPSGIVTYSQTGAQFGFGQLWSAIFMLPLMISVQEMAARIGIVTNKGIARVIKENYSKFALYFIIFLLVVANTINLGADLGAMAASSRLLLDLPFWLYLVFFFAVILILEIFLSYKKYSKILKWLTISLFSYVITGFIVATDWHTVLKATFVPHIEFNFQFLLIITGVLGTTISPYMFFWQASQEVEEKEEKFAERHVLPRATKKYLAGMRMDTFYGMLFSEIATWFIIITAAQVLHKNGITDIQSAAQAASAIEPLVHSFPYAGKLAQVLFSVGIIGTGLLAIPIFAAVSSYAISEIYEWQEGLSKTFHQARNFYLVIILGSLAGLLMNFLGINPIKALVYTAVINGIVAVPIIFMLIRISNNKKIMGKNTSSSLSRIISIITFLGMACAAIFTIYSLWHK
jgi:NRAMP (natural resistance-associated macrophage protein)-like metal ion transporter